ncbi:MAG: DUF2723 domain-containing protein [Kiritimatiellae bacterium]|nr:DUF2723 domain-containing protein [Kiritimatiellia bacterium]
MTAPVPPSPSPSPRPGFLARTAARAAARLRPARPPERPPTLGSVAPDGRFQFFQPREVDAFFEGRDAHAAIKFDAYAHLHPRRWAIDILLFCIALALYLGTMSWSAFPGQPTNELLSKMSVEATPSPTDFLWGWLVRALDRVPILPLPTWMGLFSAFCGALTVAMLADLMMNVGYLVRNEPAPWSFEFEAYGRRLSAFCAGLFLALCPPFWIASTRSLPHTFHMAMLMACACLFSRYQHWGRKRDLFALALLYGVGVAEASLFLLFLPLFAVLMLRELLRWNKLSSPGHHLLLWGTLAAAAVSLHLADARVLFRRGLFMEIYSGPFDALLGILRAQLSVVPAVNGHPGFMLLAAFTATPWIIAFLLTHRSPWFYERWEVCVRFTCFAGLLGLLYDLPYSPWRLMGMAPFVVAPYLVVAASFGYLCGEFLILGERNKLCETRPVQRVLRRISFVFALCLPLAVAGAAVPNHRTADGRYAALVGEAARDILSRRGEGRDIFFSSGLLDNTLRLLTWQRRDPTCFINARQLNSRAYLKTLTRFIVDPVLSPMLAKGDIVKFLDELLLNRKEYSRIGLIDFTNPVFLEYGDFVPDGYFYTVEPDLAAIDWDARIEHQRPFWDLLRQIRDAPIPATNPMHGFRSALLRVAGKGIDNFAIELLRANRPADANEVLRIGHSIDPDNVSILLNLASMASDYPLGDGFDPELEVDRIVPLIHGHRWNCGANFGFVWDARSWVRNGRVWAISAEVPRTLAERRGAANDFEGDSLHAKWCDIAFALYGVPLPDETACRNALVRDDHDQRALLDLAFLAMRAQDLEMARAYIVEAGTVGHAENDLSFHRAVLRYLLGEKAEAFEAIRFQTSYDTLSERLWLTDMLMAEAASDEKETHRARSTLAMFRPGTLGAHLSLARHFMDLKLWSLAQRELDRAAGIAPSSVILWEMMGEVASQTGNAALMQVSLRALQARNPQHYLKYQNEGLMAYRQGDLERAERAFRNGIVHQRNPFLLNNLAHVIAERGGDCRDALSLVEEAIRRDPTEISFLATRATVNLRLGDPAATLRDLDTLENAGQMTPSRLLLRLEALVQLGQCEEARRLALSLSHAPALPPAALPRLPSLLLPCPPQ